MKYIFCAYREHSLNVYKKLKKRYSNLILINKKENLTIDRINKVKPKYIFFPDWSWIVPNEIISNVNCICIHESDLPKFRGGSPIQNQVVRGIKNTKSTAFLMNSKAGGNDTHPMIALKGRVFVKISGKGNAGDRIVSAGNGEARVANADECNQFNVLGRIIKHKYNEETALTECVIGVK